MYKASFSTADVKIETDNFWRCVSSTTNVNTKEGKLNVFKLMKQTGDTIDAI